MSKLKLVILIESIILVIIIPAVITLGYQFVKQSEEISKLSSNEKVSNETIQKLLDGNREQSTKIRELEKKLEGTLPYKGAKENQLKITNKENVHNPTWVELRSFLFEDNTEYETYIYGERMCGEFAVRLHDNAENKGIRAAFVAVYFDDINTPPHALNAFYIDDAFNKVKELVYIDSTGFTRSQLNELPPYIHVKTFDNKIVYGCDAYAFVEVGEQLRLSSGIHSEIGPTPGCPELKYKPMGTIRSIEIYW